MLPSANCGQNGDFVNGISKDFVKWPTVVDSLFRRTKIHQLSIHCCDPVTIQDTSAIFSQLKEIFEQNKAKLQLNLIDFFIPGLALIFDNQIESFLMFSLQLAIPFLKEFRYIDGYEKKPPFPIWQIIQKCEYLNNIHLLIYNESADDRMEEIDALFGKPLKEIYISQFNIAVDGLARLLNNVSGDGVQTLFVHYYDDLNFSFFLRQIADGFNENARHKLKHLTIGGDDEDDDVLENLFVVPSMFPKLQELKINTGIILDNKNRMTQVCIINHYVPRWVG